MIRHPSAVSAFCLALAATLSGCSDPPVPHADFCAAKKRKVSKEERVVAALIFVADKYEIDQRLPAFKQFREKRRKSQPNFPIKSLAAAFYKSNPDCCRVVKPWVVREYPWFGSNGQGYHDFFNDHRKFQWTYDILIEAPDHSISPALWEDYGPVSVQSSACGKAAFLRSG